MRGESGMTSFERDFQFVDCMFHVVFSVDLALVDFRDVIFRCSSVMRINTLARVRKPTPARGRPVNFVWKVRLHFLNLWKISNFLL